MNERYEALVLAERNRNQVYDAVIEAIERACLEKKLNKKKIAEKIGKSPALISTWLAGPSNWTLDTVSHLLFAIDATMDYSVVFNSMRSTSNHYHPVERPQLMPTSPTPTANYATVGELVRVQ